MTKEEFKEFYNKNKVVVIGVPIIIGILFLNMFVLKPAREAKRRAMTGTGTATTTEQQATNVTQSVEAAAPLAPPPPLVFNPNQIPTIDSRIKSRLSASENYPYTGSRNVFHRSNIKKEDEKNNYFPLEEPEEAVEERPEVTYHGFFNMGNEKVAILKVSNKLILAKIGQTLFNTIYTLEEIFADRVIIVSKSDKNKRFEIELIQRTVVAAEPGLSSENYDLKQEVVSH